MSGECKHEFSERVWRVYLCETPECQGRCEIHGGHRGDVMLCAVKGPDKHDWGLWWYCETARDTDRRNGLEVTVVQSEPLPVTDKGGQDDLHD